jgi:hypothetical protein
MIRHEGKPVSRTINADTAFPRPREAKKKATPPIAQHIGSHMSKNPIAFE